jgi:hypothetical protein
MRVGWRLWTNSDSEETEITENTHRGDTEIKEVHGDCRRDSDTPWTHHPAIAPCVSVIFVSLWCVFSVPSKVCVPVTSALFVDSHD